MTAILSRFQYVNKRGPYNPAIHHSKSYRIGATSASYSPTDTPLPLMSLAIMGYVSDKSWWVASVFGVWKYYKWSEAIALPLTDSDSSMQPCKYIILPEKYVVSRSLSGEINFNIRYSEPTIDTIAFIRFRIIAWMLKRIKTNRCAD